MVLTCLSSAKSNVEHRTGRVVWFRCRFAWRQYFRPFFFMFFMSSRRDMEKRYREPGCAPQPVVSCAFCDGASHGVVLRLVARSVPHSRTFSRVRFRSRAKERHSKTFVSLARACVSWLCCHHICVLFFVLLLSPWLG